jgi:hypothetical protein
MRPPSKNGGGCRHCWSSRNSPCSTSQSRMIGQGVSGRSGIIPCSASHPTPTSWQSQTGAALPGTRWGLPLNVRSGPKQQALVDD